MVSQHQAAASTDGAPVQARGIRLLLTRSPGDPQACSQMRNSSWSTAKSGDVGNFKKNEERRPVGRENESSQFPLRSHRILLGLI